MIVEDTPFEPHPHLMGVNQVTRAHVVDESARQPVEKPEPVETKVIAPRRGRPPKTSEVAETK